MKLLTRIPFIFYPILLFSILTLPFIYLLPILDANIETIMAYRVYVGGLGLHIENSFSVHPPLKILLLSLSFNLFSPKILIFNLLGYPFGILGIISLYFLGKNLGGNFLAKTSSLLLSISPLFVSNAVYAPTDFLVTCLLLFTVYAYLKKWTPIFFLSLTLLVLIKETALLAVALFFLIDGIAALKKLRISLLLYSVPVITFAFWMLYIQQYGIREWSDHLFTSTASKGTFYTIFHNLISLEIFNTHASQHFLQLLFLGFQWVSISIAILLNLYGILRITLTKSFYAICKQRHKFLKVKIFILSFVIFYASTVLTLQTYTIPRYALPIIPFLILWFCASLLIIRNLSIRYLIYIVVLVFYIVGLTSSLDPIPKSLWGTMQVLGQTIYQTAPRLSGNDGITYNLQFLLLAKKRTGILQSKQPTKLDSSDCFWLKPDPVDDNITFEILELGNNPNLIQCGNLK